MAIVLFDTNILIDNFKGVPEAAAELSHYDDATIRGDSLTSTHKVKLADSIIRATAESQSRIIITRNASDFGGESPTVRVPYELHGSIAINIRAPLT